MGSEVEAVRVIDVYKSFGTEQVLGGVSLEVARGEAVGIVGPNGCGKTTLLRIIAGLEEPDRGEALVRGRLGLVPQDNLLLPWRTLRGNLELALRLAGVEGREAEERIRRVSELLGIEEHLDKYPGRVSGGTARKAAIARALALEPDILLLDEPYTGLDVASIASLQEALQKLRRGSGISMIIVSHQLDELVEIADRVYVLTHKPARVKGVVDLREAGRSVGEVYRHLMG